MHEIIPHPINRHRPLHAGDPIFSVAKMGCPDKPGNDGVLFVGKIKTAKVRP
jgi:hypothetical protein